MPRAVAEAVVEVAALVREPGELWAVGLRAARQEQAPLAGSAQPLEPGPLAERQVPPGQGLLGASAQPLERAPSAERELREQRQGSEALLRSLPRCPPRGLGRQEHIRGPLHRQLRFLGRLQ